MSNTTSTRFIDKRVRVKMMNAKEEDYTSVIVLSNDIQDNRLFEEMIKYNARIKYKLDIIKAYAIELPCKNITRIAEISQVDFIADDTQLTTFMDIARPSVGGKKAEEYNLTGEGIGIAILDTGVYPHADLTMDKNRIIAFKDFVKEREFPYDDNGHGTHVAGVAAGNGNMSKGEFRGMAPKANIIGIKVMDQEGSGSTSDIVAGMQWVLENKERYNIRIASLSLGSDPDLKEAKDPLVKGAEALWDAGIVVVTAAGNSGPSQRTINSPGISHKVITVGCSNDNRTVEVGDDTVAEFSSRGPTIEKVNKPDIVAPGVDIRSLKADVGFVPSKGVMKYKFKKMKKPYTEMSGTSMATPVVSGAIALLLEREPNLTPNQVKKRILSTATSLNANKYAQGQGQLNLEEVIN